MSAISQALALLGKEERRGAILLLVLLVGMAVFEVIGVASIMPFMLVLSEPNVVERSGLLSTAYEMLGFAQPQSFLFFLGLVVFVLLICSIAFKAGATWALWRFTNRRCHELTCRLLAGYLGQPYTWFLHRHSADLVKTSLSDVDRAVNGFLMPMFQAVAYATMSLLLFGLLLMVNPAMAVGAAVVLGGIYVAVFMLLRRYLSRIGAERVRSNLERHTIAYEIFGGIKEIKAGVVEDAFLGRFLRPSLVYSRSDTRAQLVTLLPRFALEAVAFGGLMLFLLHLITASGGLQSALPTLAVYAFAGYRLIPALQQVYSNVAMMRFNAAAVCGLLQDLRQHDSDAGIPSRRKALPQPLGLRHGLKLAGISFAYPRAERVALDGIDIDVPVHSTIGIVGATGSGKTTMVDVLLGLLRPDRGQVLVDGVALDGGTLPRWQRTLGYVPQQIFLTDDTIAANIAFGAAEADIDMHAVERAARIANLHEFVVRDLPQGYRTTVGDKGVRLSGGQRQRIGIARALYHDPDVLLFDEATSALDNLTEQAVMEAVRTLGGRKTIIMIAHRLTTVRECDLIYVFDRGAVDDQGTFEDLMSRSTRFRALATAQ